MTRGENDRVDELSFRDWDPQRDLGDVADELVALARADAEAMATDGPYLVWIVRCDEKGQPTRPTERYPLRFPEFRRSETDERMTLLSVSREQSTELARVNLELSRLSMQRHTLEIERSRDDLARERELILREREYSRSLAQMVYEDVRIARTQAREVSEALIQGDERRRAKLDEERARQVWTAMLGHLDVIVPVIASAYLRNKHGDDGSPDAVAEYKLIETFVQSVSQEQFTRIGAKLPPELRIGLMNIYQGKIAAAIVPAMAAKLFAKVDQKLAFEIWRELDPAVARSEPHAERGGNLECECPSCGQPPGLGCQDPSKQQSLWIALMDTRRNTLAARGEEALKQVGAGGIAGMVGG